jgi:S-DNA-T family DNA segregation ATPase FtsK/SpoIIIE
VIFRRELRPEARPPTLRFRAPNIHLPLWLLAVGWLVWQALTWIIRHPRSTIIAAVAGWLIVADWVVPALALVCAAAGALLIWAAADPETFAVHVRDPLRLRLREWLVYRRNWQPATLTAGLTLRDSWGGDLPRLRGVTAEGGRDVLRVGMLPGQTHAQWQAAAPALAQTFGVRAARVRPVPGRPSEVALVLRVRDSVTVTKPAGQEKTQPAPPARSPFPRQPHGGAA